MNSKSMNHKRIVSLLLVLALTISTFLSSSNIVLAAPAEGEGTAQSPYLIKTINDLFDIGLNPTAHYKLANDLDFVNTKRSPISVEFKGVLDGGGYTIKNLNILGSGANYIGIFSKISNATIKDIVFDNIKVNSENSYAGVVAGSASNSTIQVIVKNSQVTATGGGVGGIIGSSVSIKIENSKVLNTTLSGNGTVGGLSGSTSTNSNIKDNYVQDVIITGSSYMGGLIGNAGIDNVAGNKVKNVTITGTSILGGLFGQTTSTIVENCNVNEITITGTSSLGGISGYSVSKTDFKNCYATNGQIDGSSSLGGFIGQASNVTLEQCYTVIDVIATGTIVGGLIGDGTTVTVTKCFADNSIEAKSNVGGLIGTISSGGSVVNESYSNAKVKATDQTSGIGSGFIAGTVAATLKNCYSTSTVDAKTKIGLIPSITITNASNSYFNQDTTGVTTPLSHARSTEDMLNSINYGNWDFDTIWLMKAGKYPELRFRDEITEEPSVNPPEEPGDTTESGLKIILEVKEELQLSVHDDTYDKSTLQWSSSNASIVAVDSNGVILAEKIGDVVITIKDADGDVLDKVSVSVVKTLANLRITVDLNINKSCKLSVKDMQKDANITWSVMDQNVATVNENGKVTAVGQGLTIVTATDDKGSVIGQIYIRVK